jgi:hypothetical protein
MSLLDVSAALETSILGKLQSQAGKSSKTKSARLRGHHGLSLNEAETIAHMKAQEETKKAKQKEKEEARTKRLEKIQANKEAKLAKAATVLANKQARLQAKLAKEAQGRGGKRRGRPSKASTSVASNSGCCKCGVDGDRNGWRACESSRCNNWCCPACLPKDLGFNEYFCDKKCVE